TQDKEGNFYTLEQRCLENHMLPSIAYGIKGCAEMHKHRPQNKWLNSWWQAKQAWAAGERIVKCIGFDADEAHRASGNWDDAKVTMRYPLIEWDIGRERAREIIRAAGLKQPGKSACFFCPNSSKQEVFWLRDHHPDLLARAVAMEENADLTTIKGLGR